MSLLGQANYEMSLRRRESMKGLLKPELVNSLCSQDLPVTRVLLGDEFSLAVKKAKQVANLGRDVGRKEKWQP